MGMIDSRGLLTRMVASAYFLVYASCAWELIWKHITEAFAQPLKNALQFVQGQVVFPPFDTMERGVGDADLLCEISVGHLATLLFKKGRELPVKVALHSVDGAGKSVTHA